MKFEQYITHYLNNFTKCKNEWNYEDGCILMGCVQLYQATKNNFYKQFVLDYLKDFIAEEGTIIGYELEKYNIDSINPGKALFYAYEWSGKEKYLKAIKLLMEQLKGQPRTEKGNFWHKKIYPNQVWLDGLYMAQPFYMRYETKYNHKENYKDIVEQFENVRKYIFDEKKGLYYHAYDDSKQVFWADKETGKSPGFWLRAIGWYLMALVDVIEEMDETIFELYTILEELFREAIRGVLTYQDKKSHLFYQVVDHPEIEGNYLETSGSAMIGYAILKGCNLNVLLREKYQSEGEEIINSIFEKKLIETEGGIKLSDICSVAGLGPEGDKRRDGSISYYLSEPVVCDDHKGIGVCMMAYAQQLMLDKLFDT